jgi:hypothetical protein
MFVLKSSYYSLLQHIFNSQWAYKFHFVCMWLKLNVEVPSRLPKTDSCQTQRHKPDSVDSKLPPRLNTAWPHHSLVFISYYHSLHRPKLIPICFRIARKVHTCRQTWPTLAIIRLLGVNTLLVSLSRKVVIPRIWVAQETTANPEADMIEAHRAGVWGADDKGTRLSHEKCN